MKEQFKITFSYLRDLCLIQSCPSPTITPQRYTKSSRANVLDLRISCFFSFISVLKIQQYCRKNILAKTRRIEVNCATRVRKIVQILRAKLGCNQCILFFARYVSRICSIYVSLFCTKGTSISH